MFEKVEDTGNIVSGKWFKYNNFKGDLNNYQIGCPRCGNEISVPNQHNVMNFSEYIECPKCNSKCLVRRFNGDIEIQILG